MQIIDSCPAYDVVAPEPKKFWDVPSQKEIECIELKDGDELAVAYQSRNHGRLFHHYQIGSVVSYALRSGECPIKAVERATGFGHELHYIFALGTSLTAWKQARKQYIGVTHGQIVKFEGLFFEITKACNDNLGLRQVV